MLDLKGSLLEGFFPSGWDLSKIDACCSHPPEAVLERQPFWHAEFQPVPCDSLEDFNVLMGHEIALEIKRSANKRKVPASNATTAEA